MFEHPPELHGALVTLHPLRSDDFDTLYAVGSDPLIWEQHPARNRYEEPVFREFFDGAMASGGAFLVRDGVSGECIGSTRYTGYRPEDDEIEIGWTFLARRCWGGAYNGEMKSLMLQHAFRFVGRVVFLIGPENWRSRKAVEKIGGRFVGTRLNDAGRESVVYGDRAGELELSGVLICWTTGMPTGLSAIPH